jgi:hypothetical protein
MEWLSGGIIIFPSVTGNAIRILAETLGEIPENALTMGYAVDITSSRLKGNVHATAGDSEQHHLEDQGEGFRKPD